MASTSKLSPEQWAEARRMRAEGATYPQIAQRFGVTPPTIGRHARGEVWPSPADPEGSRPPRPRTASPATAGIRSRLAQRLYKVIEFKIKIMELRMQKELRAHANDPDGGTPPAPATDERDSFAALIDSINKVTEIASEPAPAAGGRRATAAGPANPELTALSDEIDADGLAAASEKDEFRREIAERLGRMFSKP
jgi:hypothetical protein